MRKLLIFCAMMCFSSPYCMAENHRKPDCTVAIVSDLHFDRPPETDQYYHVVAINKFGESRKIDGVAICGDIFDKAAPSILNLYRQRWEKGTGTRRIHYDVYPGFGNHDISPESGRPEKNIEGFRFNMNYLDSILNDKLKRGEILNVDTSSRSYSFNIGGVHFVQGQLSFGETSYCRSNAAWLESDLEKYAADGTPVVYLQHYGFDDWALGWWKKENRDSLLSLLGKYNLAAFFVGHTHQASLQYFRGCPVFQVNNAWKDGDGEGSFVLLRVKGDDVTIENCEVLDGNGTTKVLQPVLNIKIPVNK